jgi:acyl-coenzyme A synthetase/AMP-(fatty) acid ligase
MLIWDDMLAQAAELKFEHVPSDHPLWVVYSSGTTGLPKALVHGHGGILIEFMKFSKRVKSDVLLGSTSGGTDPCTGFLGSCPLLPVRAGELQCRCLGVNARAFDENGNSLTDQVGELVITEPMPSMPLCLWNDPANKRYHESYFEMYPGVWRHGDWVKFTSGGSGVILGRSDSTINRLGVRMGSSEIYAVLGDLPEVVGFETALYPLLPYLLDSPAGKYY